MNEIISNDLPISIIAQVLEEMKLEHGPNFDLEDINLAELERRTGVSRQRLRTLKARGFKSLETSKTLQRKKFKVLEGYTQVLDDLLKKGVTNSVVLKERITLLGCNASQTTVKRYVREHKDLVPPKRKLTSPQGNRGRRYSTAPGESYQMDWGFVNVVEPNGTKYQVACFAMICHHCGTFYIEFFPDAKQESLFIGMLHAFSVMGIPEYVLTDNMKSVVLRRDIEGKPIWNHDYDAFMKCVGFKTRLCKPYHPFTKGRVERLVQYVKSNFIVARSFYNISDMNKQALAWCNQHNSEYHKSVDGVPSMIHAARCAEKVSELITDDRVLRFLCPQRSISFDGFVSYEGYRFGVPYSYDKKIVRVSRQGDKLIIYSDDLKNEIVRHDVTWSKKDRYCDNQYITPQPEEKPSVPVHHTVEIASSSLTVKPEFEKFNF